MFHGRAKKHVYLALLAVAVLVVAVELAPAIMRLFTGEGIPPATLSREELALVNDKRYSGWFKGWYAEKHPALRSALPSRPPSPEEYRRRLAEARSSHPFSMALPADIAGERFADWQQSAREKLIELLFGGGLPDRAPLNVEEVPVTEYLDVQSRLSFRKYELREIWFVTRPWRRIRALVAVPKGTAPGGCVGAVVALPGHHGSPESCFGIDELSRGTFDPGAFVYSYGHILANRGFLVIAPDAGYCPFIGKRENYQEPGDGWTLEGARVWDAMRAVDYLLARDDVDPARIGVFGHSLGGETAMMLAAVDTRVALAVVSGYLQPYNPKSGCPCHIVDGLERFLRYADICSLIAPRHLICEDGVEDLGDVAVDEGDCVRYAYQVAGAGERFLQLIHDGGHVYYAGPEVLDFLEEALESKNLSQ